MKNLKLTDYDSNIIYVALMKVKDSNPLLAARIGNDHIQKLANRFKTEAEEGTDNG